MSVLAVVTNVFIFAFTTEQMMQFFPSYFRFEENTGGVYFRGRLHKVTDEGSSYVWGIVFVIEHFLFMAVAAIYVLVPYVPEWYPL